LEAIRAHIYNMYRYISYDLMQLSPLVLDAT
jgi:hypothetical protein